MTGSPEEERIRAKVVSRLRLQYPDARVVHELKLGHDIRIDVAAITANRLIVAEVKSEKDTLKRLGPQIRRAVDVAEEVWLVLHESQIARLEAAECLGHPNLRPDLVALCAKHKARISALESEEKYAIWKAYCLSETADADRLPLFRPSPWHKDHQPRSDLQLSLLWAEELRAVCRNHMLPIKPSAPIAGTKWLCREFLTGEQIRKAVCAALRLRPFARGDAPIDVRKVAA